MLPVSIMANLQDLQKIGWFLTQEGLQACLGDGKPSKDAVISNALNRDLKEIGEKKLPDSGTRNKNEHIEGPIVLQIQKQRNVSAPKDNQDSQGAPPLLKLTLTDGHTACPALEMEKINKLTVNTPPGVKVRLTGHIQISNGFLLLNKRNCEVLGGKVEKLVQNWELKRTLATQARFNIDKGGSGPPPFIPFGQRNRVDKSAQGSKKDNFKSLEQKEKESSKKEEDKEFLEQRKATIRAVIDSKEEGKGKYFGAGSTKQQDHNIAKIVEMGFSADQASAALTQTSNNLTQAITALLNDREATDPSDRDRRGPRVRHNDRTDRSDRSESRQEKDKDRSELSNDRTERGGRGRRGRDAEDEDEEYKKGPSAPATLFDFLSKSCGDKIPDSKDKSDGRGKGASSKDTSSKSYNTTTEASAEKRSGAGGPPNLPPRLVKQQRAREEERIRRISGGGRSGASSPGLTRTQPPPNTSTANTYGPRSQKPMRPPLIPHGPRGGPPMRPPFPARGPYRPGMRMDYQQKRMYDNRGPHATGNRPQWNEPDGRRGYRDNRGMRYDNRYQDNRNYNQGTQNHRRSPHQRDTPNYQNYQNRGGRDNMNQYSNPRNQYNAPPHQQHQYSGSSRSSSNDTAPTGKSYKHSRPHAPHTSEPENSENTTVTVSAQAAVDGNSASTQASEESSVVSDTVDQQESSSQEGATAQGDFNTEAEAPVEDGLVESETVEDGDEYKPADETLYNEQQPTMVPSDPSAAGPTAYMYTDGSEIPAQAQYVQMAAAPQTVIPQMAALNLGGAPVSGAPMYAATASYAPVQTLDQMYASQQMYSPQQAMPSMEYTNSNFGMNVVSSTANMVNGSKSRNANDSHKQNSRQWKAGDFCAAKFWEDQKIYRAVIQRADPSGSYCDVLFCDYGNVEQVPIADIKRVPKSAWDTNTIEPVQPMAMAAGLVSPPAMPMAPPGILIQNPPTALSFTAYPAEQGYPAQMAALPPGSYAYAPMVSTVVSSGGPAYVSKPLQQPLQQAIFVPQSPPPQMLVSQVPVISTQMAPQAQQMMTSQAHMPQ